MRTPIRRSIVPILAVVALVSACGADTPLGSTEGSKEITFESTDGVTLSGRLFGPNEGSAGIVLAHMFPSDQSAWYFFANRLGEQGYRVLTFDFRGYCPGGDAGCSEGEKNIPAIWQDVEERSRPSGARERPGSRSSAPAWAGPHRSSSRRGWGRTSTP